MKYTILALLFTPFILLTANKYSIAQPAIHMAIEVKKTNDFTINGKGTSKNWHKTMWNDLPLRKGKGSAMTTKFKILYSNTGLYFFFSCEDSILTATMRKDFMKLWKEDVIEIFLWPNKNYPTYFEYELSPLNYELPLLVTNENGNLTRWRPYMYKNDNPRRTKHKTIIQGGSPKNGASISTWTAEFFIPYRLLIPLRNIHPQIGTRWKANFYRVDYDNHVPQRYEWKRVDSKFHSIHKFGTIIFK